MIVFDNTFLALVLHPLAKPPLDPSTNLPVTYLRERIDLLIERLEEEHETIIIPTPVLSEFLILAGKDGPRYLTQLDRRSLFRIEAFDIKAAIELAAIEVSIRSSKGKRAVKRDEAQGTWAKIKFDRQIVTIAKVNGATTIYSDDEDVEKFAKRCDITVVKTWELSLPDMGQPSLISEIERLENQLVESGDVSQTRPLNPGETSGPVLESESHNAESIPTETDHTQES